MEQDKRMKLKKIIVENVIFSDFRKLEKKSARTTFYVTIEYLGQKEEIFVELWSQRLFSRIYRETERSFFSEEIFVNILENAKQQNELEYELVQNEETNEVVNEIFMEYLYEQLLLSDVYHRIKKKNPNFAI